MDVQPINKKTSSSSSLREQVKQLRQQKKNQHTLSSSEQQVQIYESTRRNETQRVPYHLREEALGSYVTLISDVDQGSFLVRQRIIQPYSGLIDSMLSSNFVETNTLTINLPYQSFIIESIIQYLIEEYKLNYGAATHGIQSNTRIPFAFEVKPQIVLDLYKASCYLQILSLRRLISNMLSAHICDIPSFEGIPCDGIIEIFKKAAPINLLACDSSEPHARVLSELDQQALWQHHCSSYRDFIEDEIREFNYSSKYLEIKDVAEVDWKREYCERYLRDAIPSLANDKKIQEESQEENREERVLEFQEICDDVIKLCGTNVRKFTLQVEDHMIFDFILDQHLFQHLTNLEHIKISAKGRTVRLEQMIERINQCCPSIRSIQLNDTLFSQDSFEMVLQFLPTHLKEIVIVDCYLDWKMCFDLSKWIQKNGELLESIRITGAYLGHPDNIQTPLGVNLLLPSIATCSNLTSLDLSNNDIRSTNLSIQSIQALGESNIRQLVLDDNPLASRDAFEANLVPAICKMKALNHLSLSRCQLSHGMVMSLLHGLKGGIKHLDISRNYIYEKGSAFCTFLSSHAIEVLDISQNQIYRDRPLADAILNCKSLKAFVDTDTHFICELAQELNTKIMRGAMVSLRYIGAQGCEYRIEQGRIYRL